MVDSRVFPTLGPIRIAAVLEKQGYSVEVLDLNSIENYEDVISNHLKTFKGTFIGIGFTTPQMPIVEKIIATIRYNRPEVKICLGGSHPTAVHASYRRSQKLGQEGRSHSAMMRLLEISDVIVAGDGEEAISIAMAPNAPKIIDADDPNTPLFLKAEQLADYPLPARHLIDLKSYKYSIDGRPSTSILGQLGCPFMCIADDTMLGLPSGLFYPDEIERPEVSICPESHVHTLGQVGESTIVYNGHRECLEIKLENRTSLFLTPDHPVLCTEKETLVWKKTGSITKDNHVAISVGANNIKEPIMLPPLTERTYKEKYPIRVPAVLDEKVAWLTGYLIADGCLPSDGRWAVTFAMKERSGEKLLNYLNDCFGFYGAVYSSKYTDKMLNVWVYSRTIRRFFEEIIKIDHRDKLRVPILIRRSPKKIIKSFIDGLMAGDGYFQNGGHPYLSTKSHLFAKEVVHLAEWIGWGGVIEYSTPDDKGHRHVRVLLCNDTCWERSYGGHPCIVASIPLDNRRIYRSKKSGKLHYRTATGHSPGVLRTTLAELDPAHPLLAGKFIYMKVVGVTNVGTRRVFDLNVPDTHMFSASGILVHNCSFCGGRFSPSLRRARLRPVENMLEEIRDIYERYGFTGLNHFDDELNVSKQLIPDMEAFARFQDRIGVEFRCRGFVKAELFTDAQARALYNAGFRSILVGAESAHPRILENIQKKAMASDNSRCVEIAKKNGLRIKCLMSIGHAGETQESIEATRNWLIEMEVEDFDCTLIQPYFSTPYWDMAIPHSSLSGVWTYVAKNGDRLHMHNIDYSRESQYYKGIPGEYQSYVFTDYITGSDLIKMRDWLETDVRTKLNIPFYAIQPSHNYEASMGMLPGHIYRRTNATP